MKLSLPSKLAISFFCLVKLVLHLIADYHSGFQGDELLHIETGNHPAFGYMEFPPLIGWLAFLQNSLLSQSVFVHHIFAHLASLLIVIYVGRTVAELGGGTRAIILALLCVLIAPGFARSQQLFQPVVFSQLFWVLAFYQLTKYTLYRERKFLWYLTIAVGLGMLTKYDAVFFIFGLLSLFLFKPMRQRLVEDRFWMPILLLLLFLTPNLLWQVYHDFPVLRMFSRLYETQLNHLSPLEVLGNLVLAINPLSLLILLPGIAYLFHQDTAKFRPLALSILLSSVFLAFSQGKAYYFFPLILTLLPFGAIFWERFCERKMQWYFVPVLMLLLPGALLIPFGMPLTSLESYLDNEYRFEKEPLEGAIYPVKFEERYSAEKWELTMQELRAVYEQLSPAEREDCLIWGKHYGQAGAVKLFGQDRGLPDVFSLHGSFYNWLPEGEMPSTIIAIRYSTGEGKIFFEPFFEEVIPVKSIYNPYAGDEEALWQTIFICKKPKQNFRELKFLFVDRVFE